MSALSRLAQDLDERLAQFGHTVLEVLEAESDWSADTMERIAREASSLGLARTGPDGLFESLADHPYDKDGGDEDTANG